MSKQPGAGNGPFVARCTSGVTLICCAALTIGPGWAAGAETHHRSIGTNAAALYATGTASVPAGASTVAFGGAACLPQNIGRGDELILDPSGVHEVVFILSRDGVTQVTLQTATASTHVDVAFSITRAYNAVQDWVDDRQGDLVADDRIEVGVCYNDDVFDELVIIDGSNTDADHYMHLTVAAGHRHNGGAGRGVRIEPSAAGHAVQILDDYTRVEWLEITDWSTDTAGSYDGVNIQANNVVVECVLVHDDGNGIATNSDANGITLELSNMTATVRNSMVYNIARSGITTHNISNATLDVENCTVFRCTQDDNLPGSYGCVGRYGGSGTVNARNVVAMEAQSGGRDFFGGAWGTSSNNLSSDDSAPGGSSLINKAALDQFVSIAVGSEDPHLKSGADAVDVGTDLSPAFNRDIDGTIRPVGGGWDMGADELGLPGVTVAESGGSTDVTEDGATDTYTLVLDSPPLADVTITVDPDVQTDLGSGAGTAIALTFTDGDWDTPQTVTVTAVDDAVAEGPHTSTITHSPTSADGSYDGIAIPDVTANITDNDTAGVTITESGGSTDVDEAGPTSDTYTLVLDSQPTADVTITVDPDVQTDLGSGAGTAIALTFTDGDWDTPQQVTVTAVDDAVAEGAHTSTITHTAGSGDASYNGIAISNVLANVTDNDTAGVTITESGGSTDVNEAGPTLDTYTVVLDSQPTADVTITVDPDTQTDLGAGPGTAVVLTFTNGDWDQPQQVTVTAVDDAVAEGAHTSTITHTVSSGDANYNGIAISNVVANITDNGTAGVSIVESDGSTDVSENGPTSDTYTLALQTKPTADVTVTVTPDDETDLGAGPAIAIQFTFTTSDWSVLRTVVVTAVDDLELEGFHVSTITHTVSSADPKYDGIAISNVVANVTDNDAAPSDDDANPEPEPEPEALADLRVTAEAPATTTDVLVGDEVVFTVTVENVGTAAATDIALTIPMPENAEFVLARLVTGPPTQAADPVVTAGDRFVTLELGDVLAGDSLQVEIVFRVIAGGEVVVSPSATSEEVTTPKEAETAATIVAEDEYLRFVETTAPLYLCGPLGVAPLFLLFGLVGLKRRGPTRGVGPVSPTSLP